jgi:hypothetical protein
MSDHTGARSGAMAAALGLWLVMVGPAAGQGRLEINQQRALAGGLTPGDAPGFPVSITQPGSYVLTSNLDLVFASDPRNTNAIVIAASFVTLDLGGFTIHATNQCNGSQDGCAWSSGASAIEVGAGAARGVVIHSGSIRGVGGSGIRLGDTVGARIEDVEIAHAGDSGVSVAASGSAVLVAGARVSWVGEVGLDLSAATLLLDSAIEETGFVGAYVGDGGLVLRNRILGSSVIGLGCRTAGSGEYGLADNVLVGNGTIGQFIGSCGNELAPNRCGSGTACP